MKFLFPILFNLLLMLSPTAFAIDKHLHDTVSQVAYHAYQDCLNSAPKTQPPLEDKSIAQKIGSGAEMEDIWPAWDRLFNWHFYDAYRNTPFAMGKNGLGAKKSLHDIYEKRVKQLIQALKQNQPEDIWELTGRVLHYIQDMHVPAHVAPIYHYNIYIVDQSDHFDKLEFWNSKSYTFSPSECSSIQQQVETLSTDDLEDVLNVLLVEAAEGTLLRIQHAIPAPQGHWLFGETWASAFWRVRDPFIEHTYPDNIKYGFAPYGKFGNEGITKLCTSNEATDQNLCHGFTKMTYREALLKSAMAIGLVVTKGHL